MSTTRDGGAVVNVEVAYGAPGRVHVVRVAVPAGSSVEEAVRKSGLAALCPEITPASNDVGIFGRPCPWGRRVRDGDRIEIYRPLRADPKEARRLRAARQQRK